MKIDLVQLQKITDYIRETESENFDEHVSEGNPPYEHIYALAFLVWDDKEGLDNEIDVIG